MDWAGLKRELEAAHTGDMLALERIRHALQAAEYALSELARLGHRYWLTEEPQQAKPAWPRLLFHVDAAPNGRLVRSEFEAAELGPGWFDSLAAAQHWDGVETQFAGRGGVPRTAVPTALALDLRDIARQQAEAAAAKQRTIDEFKARLAGRNEESAK